MHFDISYYVPYLALRNSCCFGVGEHVRGRGQEDQGGGGQEVHQDEEHWQERNQEGVEG